MYKSIKKIEYTHTVQYYETDKMGITHHSNYIRWMEEARVNFLAKIGWDYAKLEKMGIVSPVINVTCDFKLPTTFSDEVAVIATLKEFRGVSLKFEYEMRNKNGGVVCVASSLHALLNTDGKPARVKRDYPELFEVLNKLICEEE